jgi:uncharacterized membrane protein
MYIPEPDEKSSPQQGVRGIAVTLIVLFASWSLVGFIAFITSVVCIFKNSTIIENVFGLLLSILLGPLYFFYFFLSASYCS